MAYKDKDRQRQAVREATRRYRLRKQGITSGVSQVSHKESITVIDGPLGVIPKEVIAKAKAFERQCLNATVEVQPKPVDDILNGDGVMNIEKLERVRDMAYEDEQPEPQSHSPMVVGYVPPKEGANESNRH